MNFMYIAHKKNIDRNYVEIGMHGGSLSWCERFQVAHQD